MSRFNCDACGLCCQNLDANPLYSDLDDGTGVCRHYDHASRRCGIYAQRPLKCRIDESYEHSYAHHLTREQFHALNQAACETLKSKKDRIDMPLPLLLIGAAVLAGGAGVAGGVKGAKKISEAKGIVSDAEGRYNRAKDQLDNDQKQTDTSLEALGSLKLDVSRSFGRFAAAYEKIKNKPDFKEFHGEDIRFSKHQLDEIKQISISAIDLLGSSALTASAGALAGFAAYGGTMALGVASTGTAISSLSGVAAYNATLAALGGGALSAGGGGMALGSMVLSGAVAGPVIAVGGLLLNAKGNSSLEKAEEIRKKVDNTVQLMKESTVYLKKLKLISDKVIGELTITFNLYLKHVTNLEQLVQRQTDYNAFNQDEKDLLSNNIMLVKLLTDLVQTVLVDKKNGKDVVLQDSIHKELAHSQDIRGKLAA